MRILIADDHSIVRKGLKQILVEEFPFATIEETGDAEGLVKKALSQNWDIVITDLSMPGRSGLDAINQIKQQHPKLPILILSMYPEEQYAMRVLKSGAAQNDLFDRIAADALFGIDRPTIERLARPEDYTGLSRQQTERFLIEDVDPILEEQREHIRAEAGEVRV